jgi:hypothetical protein
MIGRAEKHGLGGGKTQGMSRRPCRFIQGAIQTSVNRIVNLAQAAQHGSHQQPGKGPVPWRQTGHPAAFFLFIGQGGIKYLTAIQDAVQKLHCGRP